MRFQQSQNPRVSGLQRDAEGLEGQPLTCALCHGAVLAAFPRELLKNGSRVSSIYAQVTSTAKEWNWKLRHHSSGATLVCPPIGREKRMPCGSP
jgi:hypothetical protein